MKKICPLIQKECLEHGCEFYTHLIGQNPQSGAQEDKWGCAVTWLPILLIENAGTTRKVVAGLDKVAAETRRVATVAAGGEVVLDPVALGEAMAGGTVLLSPPPPAQLPPPKES